MSQHYSTGAVEATAALEGVDRVNRDTTSLEVEPRGTEGFIKVVRSLCLPSEVLRAKGHSHLVPRDKCPFKGPHHSPLITSEGTPGARRAEVSLAHTQVCS